MPQSRDSHNTMGTECMAQTVMPQRSDRLRRFRGLIGQAIARSSLRFLE
jgi:hypothetical protein